MTGASNSLWSFHLSSTHQFELIRYTLPLAISVRPQQYESGIAAVFWSAHQSAQVTRSSSLRVGDPVSSGNLKQADKGGAILGIGHG